MPTSQSNVGQQVEAQAVASAMAGERTFKRIEFPVTGDPETELIDGITVILRNVAEMPFERIASVFDFMAKRYRDAQRETERQGEFIKQASQPFPPMYAKGIDSPTPASPFSYPTVPQKTASEVLAIERQMRDEMREKMLSDLHKNTIR